ncbi:MAG: patatin-like phospholipase family protein [Solirubrobacterales bacterium]|nr:patatin-like phospholipase family protein [Solirubrobacterales bacterium]
MTVSVEFFRQVPLFADLSDELLVQLAGEAGEVRARAGEWLFREGDEADRLYLIRSGRLEVVDEGPPETLIRELRRGQAVGELALLQRGTRTASVRARRDADLIELSRDRFEALISGEPSFAVGLTHAMGAQLAANRAPAESRELPSTIAVLALDEGMSAPRYAGRLAESLAHHGSVEQLSSDPNWTREAMSLALGKAEESAERVVMTGTSHLVEDPWNEFCLREADLVVALTSGHPAAGWIQRPNSLQGCCLLGMGSGLPRVTVGALQPRETQVVADGAELEEAIEVLARRISGRSLGIVLSGGGARAFAHVGAMEEFEAAGLKIDRVAGVSLGSLVGAGIAMGHSSNELAEIFHIGFIENNPTGDYSVPLYSLIRGKRTEDLLERMFGEIRIEELQKRFFCLSCDLVGREPVLHQTGLVREAVLASLSIPGVFPPIPTPEGRLLVDGGVLDNLPVETMARSNEGPIIAVDVTGQMGDFRRSARPGITRLKRPLRRALTGRENELPRLAETIVRTVTVGSIDTAEAARRHADLVVQPEVGAIGLLEWGALERAREAGRLAARAALEGPHDWLEDCRGKDHP